MEAVLIFTGSRRRRLSRSGLGDDAIEMVSAFPLRLLIEGLSVATDGVELEKMKRIILASFDKQIP